MSQRFPQSKLLVRPADAERKKKKRVRNKRSAVMSPRANRSSAASQMGPLQRANAATRCVLLSVHWRGRTDAISASPPAGKSSSSSSTGPRPLAWFNKPQNGVDDSKDDSKDDSNGRSTQRWRKGGRNALSLLLRSRHRFMGFVGGLGTCGDAHTQSLSFPKCCILPPSSSSSSFPPRHLTCHVGHLLRRENMPKLGPPSWANFAIARMSPPYLHRHCHHPCPSASPKLPPKTPQSWGEDNDGPPFVP